MERKNFYSIGKITKKDWIMLNDRIDFKSALVFISEYPYSGYYGSTVPDKKEPQSMYLVTDQNYSDDSIIRSIQQVKKDFEYSFDAVPGTISFLNKNLGMIRVRCVSYEHVPHLIEAFTKKGIEFMPHRNFTHFEGIIRVTKYFKTEEIEDGIFLDLDNPYLAYLHIDRFFNWDTFEKIYRDVRNNITEFTFDAAQAIMYNERGVLDFVRIYDEKRTPAKLTLIHRKFNDLMGKY